MTGLDKPALGSDGNGFCTAHCVQLCEYRPYVTLYCIFADIENLSYLHVASAIRNIFAEPEAHAPRVQNAPAIPQV